VETGLNALVEVDTASALRPATSMFILTVSRLNVLGPVLAQGPVSRLTVNNPNGDHHLDKGRFVSTE